MFLRLLTPLNAVFVLLELFVFIHALWSPGSQEPKRIVMRAAAPSTLTGIGILGTFLGIFLGLLRFDVADVDASVPHLLQGMTTAFLSSVTGLLLAITLRWILRTPAYESSNRTAGRGVQDVYGALLDLKARLQAEAQETRRTIGTIQQSIDSLRVAIGGEGDTSLVSQTRLLRSETRDGLDGLTKKFEKFAESVSELGTKALIGALSDVIRDFNTQLTEQFGENFKHLNAAVEKLVAWQANYADAIVQLEAQFRRALEGVEGSRVAIAEIATSSGRIPTTMQLLSAALERLEVQGRALDAQLSAFADTAEKARGAFPVIEENIGRLTTGFSEHVQHGLTTQQRALDEQRRAYETIAREHQVMQSEYKRLVQENSQSVQALRDGIRESLETMRAQLQEHHARAADKWEQTLSDSVERTQDVMQKQVANLDQTLDRELQKALDALSRSLLGLHQKLVADYTPLLEQMRRVIELGRRGGSAVT